MNSDRAHPERDPKWVEEQKKKIKMGIEDDSTREYQTDLKFEKLWEV